MKVKRFFFSVVALCCAVVAWAQQNDMSTAILQHEAQGEVQTSLYIGMDALINAHEAAVDGDVITLSAGTFYLASIRKAVSVYGTGFEANEATGTDVTTLVKKDGYNMQVGKTSSGVLENVHLEGLRIDCGLDISWNNGQQTDPVKNLTVTKCYITGNIAFNNNITDVKVSQCVITGGVFGNSATYLATNLTICNCHIGTLVRTFAAESSVLIDHCIIKEGFYHDDQCDVSAFTWQNCIFVLDSWYHRNVGYGSHVYNNIFPNFERSLPATANCEGNFEVPESPFVGGNATYSPENTFEIKAPTVWIGNDGTEIGINGGEGFSKVPATPVVKNLSAIPEGTKLNVSFETHARPVPVTNTNPEP